MIILPGNAVEKFIAEENSALLHVCNCQGVMGSGIAREIKEKIPDAYDSYKEFEFNHGLHLGTVSSAWFNSSQIVHNLHAQKHYGTDGKRYLNYEAFWQCLEKVRDYLPTNIESIIIPFNIGCDRAGGNWAIVSTMIQQAFGKYHIVAYKL